jgi:tetratricopeptide (TPR) repeat protein
LEKNRILDPFYKAFLLLGALTFLSYCSLPRIVILEDPLTPEEHINLGVSYERKGELGPALKEYERAAKKLPIAYLYAGNVYFQKKELKDAERSYRQAIKKTGDARAFNNLAWLFYDTGEHLEEAEMLARKAVELEPGSKAFRDTLDQITEKRKAGVTP